MNTLTTAGRILYALPFIVFGALHLMSGPAMAAFVPIPGGVVWVYFTGIVMIAAGIGIVTGMLGKWAALGLALLLLIFVVTIHVPGVANAQTRQMALVSLLKDLALAGGALTWAGVFAATERDRTERGGTPTAPRHATAR